MSACRVQIDRASSVFRLLDRVCEKHGADVDRVLAGGRFPVEVRARYEWARLVADTWCLTSKETGRLIGIDPWTVRLALRRHARERRLSGEEAA